MSLDPYTPCPCGSGKKLKFCECHTEAAELEKIMVAIDGDQRVAALDMLDRQLAGKPKHKAFLALKGMVQLHLHDYDAARKTSEAFLALAPKNAVALTLSAYCELHAARVREAILKLQKALEFSGDEIHYLVPDALFGIAQALLMQGHYVACRAHLLLRLGMMPRPEEDRQSTMLLMELDRSPEVPLLARQYYSLRECSPGAAYGPEFASALDVAAGQGWLASLTHFEALDRKYPQRADILYNISLLQLFMADERATATLRRLSQVPGLSPEEAVEAEMMAQEFGSIDERDQVHRIRIIYKVKDASLLLERFTGDKRLIRMNVDPRELVPEGQPPPRGAWWLLDRDASESGENLTREQVPVALGEVLVFGRETDRDARVEFLITKTTEMLAKVRRLQDVGGDQLGMIEKEEKIGATYALDEALVTRWRLPADTSPEVQRQLLEEQYRHNIFEVLPQVPLQLFGGKCAREVSADPQYRLALLALIRAYELQYQQDGRDVDFNELRRRLGLPPQEAIDPTGLDIAALPLARLDRLDVTRLSGEQLATLVQQAARVSQANVIRTACREALQREDLPPRFHKSEAMELLARFSTDLDEALQHIAEAQHLARAAGRSPARMLLLEFDLRLARGDSQELQRILTELQMKHIREPGIAEALYSKLMRLGLINQDGSPRFGPPPSAPGAVPDLPAAAGGGGLWTPDGPAAPAAKSESSRLWLPGMD